MEAMQKMRCPLTEIYWQQIYSELVNITGWTWDYIRNNMTFKRYDELKKSWQEFPPLAITSYAIAKCLGFDKKTAPNQAMQSESKEVFYDESYYENTDKTPWQGNAYEKLAVDFETANQVRG